MELYGGILLYRLQDDHHPIEVIETNGLRSLHLGTSSKQSAMSIDNPFALAMKYSRVMMLALLFHAAPQKALFLGLGGGSMVKFLWKHFPKCSIAAVDNDPNVANVSFDYFALPKSKRIKIHIDDAIEFVAQSSPSTYDYLFMDLFIGSGIPTSVSTEGFFQNCYRIIKPGGLLIWNTWTTTPQKIMEDSLKDLCKSFGKHLLILPSPEGGNNLIFAFKEPINRYPLNRLQKNAQRIKTKTKLDLPSLMAEMNNFKGYGYLYQ